MSAVKFSGHFFNFYFVTRKVTVKCRRSPSFRQNWLACWLLMPGSQVRIPLSTDIFLPLSKRSESLRGYCSVIKMPAVEFSWNSFFVRKETGSDLLASTEAFREQYSITRFSICVLFDAHFFVLRDLEAPAQFCRFLTIVCLLMCAMSAIALHLCVLACPYVCSFPPPRVFTIFLPWCRIVAST